MNRCHFSPQARLDLLEIPVKIISQKIQRGAARRIPAQVHHGPHQIRLQVHRRRQRTRANNLNVIDIPALVCAAIVAAKAEPNLHIARIRRQINGGL